MGQESPQDRSRRMQRQAEQRRQRAKQSIKAGPPRKSTPPRPVWTPPAQPSLSAYWIDEEQPDEYPKPENWDQLSPEAQLNWEATFGIKNEEAKKIPITAWEDYVFGVAVDQIKNSAKILGLSPDAYEGWFDSHRTRMVKEIMPAYFGWTGNAEYYQRHPEELTVEHITGLGNMAIWWLQKERPELQDGLNKPTAGGGGGGRGRGGPTLKSFDIDAMATEVSDMWRGWLLQDAPDPRGIARAYVNQVLGDPDQALDFENYVRTRIEGSAQYQVLAKRKPEALSYPQFMQPYLQSALQVLGPGQGTQVADIVGGGMQLASSPYSFGQRLQREDQVTQSAPFINRLEAQLRSVAGVFRGS